MTPLEIIGLVSAIITFIDFAAENVAVAREIERTGSATFKDNTDLERRVKLVEEHVTGLNAGTIGAPRDTNEVQLLDLVEEYKSLTVQLMTLLAGLKSTRKRHILSKMVKDFRKKDEKETLQKELDDCRSRIHLQLTQLTRSELSRRLNEISAQGRINATEIQHLGENIKELQSNVELWKHIPGLVEGVHDILSRSKVAIEDTAQRLILEKLYVGDMTRRFDEIERAHEKTFSWLLGSETPPSISDFDSLDWSESNHSDGSDYEPQITLEGTAKELQAQQGLVDWLAHGRDIFHISGKPGAGKSTLMKYLCQSTVTESYLKDWAGNKKLISANFFFWKLGSAAQKSLDGLLRALSYSILQQAPALLKTVLPKQWGSAIQGEVFTIQNSEIESAFSSLLRQTSFFYSHKVALFIDGLDEFDGDHDKMTKIFRNWIELVPGDIKLCLASREWEVFRQRLANCPGFRTQDITGRDIEAYVSSELSENEDFKSYALTQSTILSIIEEIKTKAQGVFLWVKITLRGLKWRFLSGERLGDLLAKLDALPAGLDELFTSILDSITNGPYNYQVDRSRAIRMILLAAEAENSAHPLLLTDTWFLDEYGIDPDFALKSPIAAVDSSIGLHRQERARRSVYQRCMCLLEVNASNSDARPLLMKDLVHPSLISGVWYDIDLLEEINHMTSGNSISEIESSLTDGTARIHREELHEVIDEGDDEFLHKHAWYYDMYKINQAHPSKDQVRAIHRSVVEFLHQPHIRNRIRVDALSFNAQDFRLQSFLASLKIFRPCLGFLRKQASTIIKDLLREFLLANRGSDASRLTTFVEELVRVLEAQNPNKSIGSQECLKGFFRTTELLNTTEVDGSLDVAVYVDLFASSLPLSLDGGLYQLGRQQKRGKYYNILLDFCLYQICTNIDWKLGRKAYVMRICDFVLKCFISGADPNGRSLLRDPSGGHLTCWQAWLMASLTHVLFHEAWDSFIRQFLLHGADPNIWVRFGQHYTCLWWAGAGRWHSVGADFADLFNPREVKSRMTSQKIASRGRETTVNLVEFLPIYFGEAGAELRGTARV